MAAVICTKCGKAKRETENGVECGCGVKLAKIEYRGHTFPGYNKPVKNKGTDKHKMMVLAKKGDKVKLVRFGHKDYGHNISKERKENYLKRSAGIRNKDGELTKNDKFSANYWARRILWPKGQKADGSAKKTKTSSERTESGALIPDEILSSADKRIPGNVKDIGKHIPTRAWTAADDIRSAFKFAPGKSTAKALGALAAAGGLGYGAVKGVQKGIENRKQEEAERVKNYPVEVSHKDFSDALQKFYENPSAMLSGQMSVLRGAGTGLLKGTAGGAGTAALLSLLATKGVPAVSRYVPKHSLKQWLSKAVPAGAFVGGVTGYAGGALGGAKEHSARKGFSQGGAFKTHRMTEERARKAKVEDLRKQGSILAIPDQLIAGGLGSIPAPFISGAVAKKVAPEGRKAIAEDRVHRTSSIPTLVAGLGAARAADKSGLTRKALEKFINRYPMGAVAKGQGILLERALIPTLARTGAAALGAGLAGAGMGAVSGLMERGRDEQEGEKVAKDRCWRGYEPVPGKKPYSEDSCRPVGSKKDKKKESSRARKGIDAMDLLIGGTIGAATVSAGNAAKKKKDKKKEAKKDMPDFLDQDRPESVKKIYRALKRDHPEMSAEMKARIAARQGKKGKQKQGPPYKGPIEKKSSVLLSAALDRLWDCYGGPTGGEKTAAGYFHSIQKPELDRECFGEEFCKVANASGIDPWELADKVASQLDAFLVLEKTAEDLRVRELAGFYRRWAADTMEKAAGIRAMKAFGSKLKNLSSAGKMDTAIKGLKAEGGKAVDTVAGAVGPSAVPKKKKDYTLGEKALGGIAIGAPIAGGMALMGSGDNNA